MWWQPSYFLGMLSMLYLLGSCGFEPIYANRSEHNIDTPDLLAAVQIDGPPGRLGELLKASIEDQFNPTSRNVPVAYRLKTKLNLSSAPYVIEQDGTASRYTITLSSPYTIEHINTKEVLEKGTVRRQVSYNVSEDDDYSTFITKEQSLKRGVIELAEDYKMRLSALMVKLSKYYRGQYEASRPRY